MTLKEAVLQSLEDLKTTANHTTVYHHILNNNYYDFGKAKTPPDTISSTLGDFIRKGDNRVKRIPQQGGTYIYYLAKYEHEIGLDKLDGSVSTNLIKITTDDKQREYQERSLHKLLSSYLRSDDIHSKTIFHEQSINAKNLNQIWSHPDMVGIKLYALSSVTRGLAKSVDKKSLYELSSYEIKKTINSDNELKQAFFQAVSNSSWANQGYLVAFDFNGSLYEEMERLSKSFGIGIIKLNGNPFRTQILFQSAYRSLDLKTIDKLCGQNKNFELFIKQTSKLIDANDDYYPAVRSELSGICDPYFTSTSDQEFEKYCNEKNIPFEKEEIDI